MANYGKDTRCELFVVLVFLLVSPSSMWPLVAQIRDGTCVPIKVVHFIRESVARPLIGGVPILHYFYYLLILYSSVLFHTRHVKVCLIDP
uniref:Uncharacterized protein n=1 Tax=Anopheles darlingi TaxID=43151 RepID=A0A2M4DJ61_ANODA